MACAIITKNRMSKHSISGYGPRIFVQYGNKTIMFSPYCVTQNLSDSCSLMLSTFLCEAEGELLERTDETENIRWMKH